MGALEHVDSATLASRLEDGLAALKLDASEDQRTTLLQYVALLHKWNRAYNLTAIRDPEQMVSLHLLDSLSLLHTLDSLHPRTLCDVGSGAGLPGIPVAIMRPNLQVTMVDCIAKKTTFIQECIGTLKLRNASVITARVEELPTRNEYDVVTSRAYAELADFVNTVQRLCSTQTTLVAMKGTNPVEEITRLPNTVRVESVVPLHVPQVEAQRHLVVLKLTRYRAA